MQLPDGPVRHVVEQLWAPTLDAGRARLDVGDAPQGWHAEERYLVLPTLSRATMLIPAGPRPATAGALLNYRGLRRPTANLQRTVLGGAHRIGRRLPFPRLTLSLPDGAQDDGEPALPLAAVARALGTPDRLHASIGVRTSANRKATLQLVDDGGRPRGFAKFAWDRLSTEGIEREGAALAVTARGPARSPALLARGTYSGHPFIVTEPLPLTTRGVRADVPEPTPQELASLTPVVRHARLSGTGQAQGLRARLGALASAGFEADVVAGALRLLDRAERSEVVLSVTARSHGDLTPWNSARDRDGTLWCWDWESSEPDTVWGVDPLHWHVSVRTEAGQPLGADVLRAAYDAARPALVAGGLGPDGRPLVLAVYVATLVERACSLAAGGGGWEAGWVLPAQLRELVDTTEGLLP